MSSITLRFLAESSSQNFGNKISGGTIMKWINEAGYVCASHWAKADCMTVSMGAVHFKHPIVVGSLVQVQARLAYTGHTSMNITVEVRSSDIKTGHTNIITECLVVFVAVDTDGKPLPVQPWLPETPGDMALAEQVKAHLKAARAMQPGT